MDFSDLTIKQARDLIKKDDLDPKELLGHYIDTINEDNKSDKPVNAVIHLDQEDALKQIDTYNKDLPLYGIPVLIKDNFNYAGHPVQCASKILEGYVSPYDGGVADRLKAAGAIVFGRSNMDEFAMGSSTEYSAHGITRNPRGRDYIPGGSSGGSAAAVAAGHTLCALGSDTGGSIRQPASFCGVVGMKPTYGRVSRFGLVAYGSSLDQIGPLARTVEDAAILLGSVSGYDRRDSTSIDCEVPDYTADLTGSLKGKKIGLPKEYYTEALSSEIKEHIDKVIDFYKQQGCVIVEVSLASTEYAVGTYYIIATAEASANLARFDGIRYGRRSEADNLRDVYYNSRNEGFGDEVKRRILLGTYVLSSGYYDAYYLKAQKVRRVIKNDFDKVLQDVDILLTPVSPVPAFKIGERTDDPVSMYLADIYTTSVNLAGVPGISVPCGTDPRGLPIGVQLLGAHFNESLLFNFAHVLEQGLKEGV